MFVFKKFTLSMTKLFPAFVTSLQIFLNVLIINAQFFYHNRNSLKALLREDLEIWIIKEGVSLISIFCVSSKNPQLVKFQ